MIYSLNRMTITGMHLSKGANADAVIAETLHSEATKFWRCSERVMLSEDHRISLDNRKTFTTGEANMQRF